MARIGQPVPKVFLRGRYYATDLRKWGGGRPTLRNPNAPGWPKRGEQTEFEDKAIEWAIRYRDHLLHRKYRRLSGQPEEASTLEDAVERFAGHRERTAEEWTRAGDSTALGHLVTAIGANVPADAVDPAALQGWFNARLDGGYKRSTLRQYRNSMSAFFKWLGGPNPAREIVLPKPDSRDARAWTDAELRKLRKAASQISEEHRRFLEIGLCTGGRFAELLALEAGDFDKRHHTVRFKRQAIDENATKTKGLKGDKNRTALVLPEWWAWHTPKREGPIVRVKRGMREILDKAGLSEPEILNHAMRHSYARICRESYHIPISILRIYLGHLRESTTEMYYGWMGKDVAVEFGHRVVYG